MEKLEELKKINEGILNQLILSKSLSVTSICDDKIIIFKIIENNNLIVKMHMKFLLDYAKKIEKFIISTEIVDNNTVNFIVLNSYIGKQILESFRP